MTGDNFKEYILSEGLNKLVPFFEDFIVKENSELTGDLNQPFPPQVADLVRLHKLVRERKSFTVLEFGVGYSTVILADALAKNENDWSTLSPKPNVRNNFMFQLFSVDTSKDWIKKSQDNLPKYLKDRVHFHFSEAEVGTFNGQLCHYYKQLPDIVPDFIYLDGPNPKDVKGNVRGLSFQPDERTVMAGDLLLMESTFLPGTFIIIDGRTNNARFLERNFNRLYAVNWDKKADITTFELKEERLGKHNKIGSDFHN